MSKANYKQVYAPYWEWEDFNAGMYEDYPNKTFQTMVKNSVSVLADSEFFLQSSLRMVNEWKVSAVVNLTNPNGNKRAWIGQATCCYMYGCSERATRQAWATLTEAQRSEANKAADKLISHYEEQNRGVFKGLGI